MPGELYSVQQLSDLLGVSRSPVREGLLSLAAAGMVTFERNRGFRVSVPDGRDVAEIFAVRLALEPAAAARVAAAGDERVVAELTGAMAAQQSAAERGDESAFWTHDRRLHQAILGAAGNRRSATIVEDLRRATWLLGGRTTPSRSMAEIIAEHRPIVAGIAAADPRRAHQAMHDHLTRTGRLLLAQALGPTADAARVEQTWTDVTGGPHRFDHSDQS